MVNYFMRDKTLKDIETYLTNGGLVFDEHMHDFARAHNLFKYVGYSNSNYQYLVGYKDPENEGNMYVCTVYVGLGHDDQFVADYSGCPDFMSTDLNEIIAYVKNYATAS